MTDPELSIPIMSPERCDEGTIFTPEEVLARLDAKAKLTAHELGDAPDEARAMAATVRTLLSALSRGEGWEPIETAPKDGTVVLGWDRNSWFPDLMAWCKPNEWYDDGSHEGLEATDTPQWVHADWLLHREAGAIGPDDAIGLHGPEYWMPLPKDPPPHDFAADHAETILRAYAAPPVPEGA